MAARKQVLFLIRDKLGDSLIAANVALLFARHHPEWRVSVMIRDAYAPMLANESALSVVHYRSGISARLLAAWWRLTGRRYDTLGVMRGFGSRTMALMRAIPARHIVVHDARLASLAHEVARLDPAAMADDPHYGPALRVARTLDADLPAPERLELPGLAARWAAATKRHVVICPLSDEERRNIPAAPMQALYADLQRRHPDQEVLVLVRGEEELRATTRWPGMKIATFRDIPGMISVLLQTSHLYGTDTGMLHLAAAMGMPCRAFFGPTQPHRVLAPGQSNVTYFRDPTLGDRHCDVKSCVSAVCIARAIALSIDGGDHGLPLAPELPDCPLAVAANEPTDPDSPPA